MRGFVPFPAHIRALLVLLYVINKKERSNETRFKDRTQSLCVLSKAQTTTTQNATLNKTQNKSVIIHSISAICYFLHITNEILWISLYGALNESRRISTKILQHRAEAQ